MDYGKTIKTIISVLKEDKYMTLGQLSIEANIPERSIRTILKTVDPAITGVEIQSKIGSGYRCRVIDKEQYQQFISEEDSAENRINQLLLILLNEKGYVTIEEIADRIFLSRATVDRLIPHVRDVLNDYELELVTKPKTGIKIQGSEKAKRMCLVRRLLNRDREYRSQDFNEIQELLYDCLVCADYEISDNAFINLTYHLMVALGRVRQGNGIMEEIDFPKLAERREFVIAEQIIKAVETHFQVVFSPQEVYYVAMHLMGKKIIRNSSYINSTVMGYVDLILRQIKEEKRIDLTHDSDLKTALALHIQPLVARVRFDLQVANPILMEIKREMNLSYEVALLAKRTLEKLLDTTISEDEAGYLAMHFAVALDKQISAAVSSKILVVCTTGGGTARLLKHRLINKFSIGGESIQIISMFQLQQVNLCEYACILSTVELADEYPIPVIVVNAALAGNETAEKINTVMKSVKNRQMWGQVLKEEAVFPDCELASQEEILRFMAEKMISLYGLESDFTDKILAREQLSSTEVGNLAAYPHPLHYSGETFLSVMTLKKAVVWKNTKVKYIFMIATPERETERSIAVNEAVTEVICDSEALMKLRKNVNYKTVLEVLGG